MAGGAEEAKRSLLDEQVEDRATTLFLAQQDARIATRNGSEPDIDPRYELLHEGLASRAMQG